MTRTSADGQARAARTGRARWAGPRAASRRRVLLEVFAQQNAKQYPALQRELDDMVRPRGRNCRASPGGDPTLAQGGLRVAGLRAVRRSPARCSSELVAQRAVAGRCGCWPWRRWPRSAIRRVAAILLDALPAQTPAVRGAMLDALLSQTARTKLLLDRIAAKEIRPDELDTLRANRRAGQPRSGDSPRAAKLLASALPADRAKALAKFQASLELKADARHGKEVFRKNCSTCHQIDDVGVDVGPSIGDARTKTPAQLLMDILQPSKAIDNNFVSYSVVTDRGQHLHRADRGRNAHLDHAQNARGQDARAAAQQHRGDAFQRHLADARRPGADMSVAEMADVITFIKNWRYSSGNDTAGPGRREVPATGGYREPAAAYTRARRTRIERTQRQLPARLRRHAIRRARFCMVFDFPAADFRLHSRGGWICVRLAARPAVRLQSAVRHVWF